MPTSTSRYRSCERTHAIPRPRGISPLRRRLPLHHRVPLPEALHPAMHVAVRRPVAPRREHGSHGAGVAVEKGALRAGDRLPAGAIGGVGDQGEHLALVAVVERAAAPAVRDQHDVLVADLRPARLPALEQPTAVRLVVYLSPLGLTL